MNQEVNILTRRELYDLVWSKPMSKLAEEFGVSDRELAKICERHRVPSPPRGYWAKLAAGHKVRQAIFHQVNDPKLDSIQISASLSTLPEATREILGKAREARKAQVKPNRSPKAQQVVFEPPERVHKLLAKTAKLLRKSKPDEYGGVNLSDEGAVGVSVHCERIERSITFLDKLVRTLSADKSVALTVNGQRFAVVRGPDQVCFTLKERTRREKHEPTAEELAAYRKKKEERRQRYSEPDWSFVDLAGRDWDQTWPDFDTIYTGDLIFSIDGWGDGLRKNWGDGKTQSIEGMFDQILTGIEAWLSYEKSRREERAERARQSEIFAHRRHLARQRIERENRRLELLNELLAARREAENLRGWLHSIELADDHQTNPELTRMIAWARGRLTDLEERSRPETMAEWLQRSDLFPEDDPYHDPLGEPPSGYGFGY